MRMTTSVSEKMPAPSLLLPHLAPRHNRHLLPYPTGIRQPDRHRSPNDKQIPFHKNGQMYGLTKYQTRINLRFQAGVPIIHPQTKCPKKMAYPLQRARVVQPPWRKQMILQTKLMDNIPDLYFLWDLPLLIASSTTLGSAIAWRFSPPLLSCRSKISYPIFSFLRLIFEVLFGGWNGSRYIFGIIYYCRFLE